MSGCKILIETGEVKVEINIPSSPFSFDSEEENRGPYLRINGTDIKGFSKPREETK